MTAHHLKVAGDLPESILECIRSRSGPVIDRRPCIGRSRKRHPDRIASERSYNVPDNAGRRSRGHDRTSCMSALCTKFAKWGRSNTSQTLIKNEALPTRVSKLDTQALALMRPLLQATCAASCKLPSSVAVTSSTSNLITEPLDRVLCAGLRTPLNAIRAASLEGRRHKRQ